MKIFWKEKTGFGQVFTDNFLEDSFLILEKGVYYNRK